jgi:hypothetical protein
MSNALPPSDPELPRLTLDVVEDGESLSEAVDAFIQSNPEARQRLTEIAEHQEALRQSVDSETWKLVLRIDEMIVERWSDLAVDLTRWSFDAGRQFRWPGTARVRRDPPSYAKRGRGPDGRGVGWHRAGQCWPFGRSVRSTGDIRPRVCGRRLDFHRGGRSAQRTRVHQARDRRTTGPNSRAGFSGADSAVAKRLQVEVESLTAVTAA